MRRLFGLLLVVAVLVSPLMAVTTTKAQALPKVDLVMWHEEGADVMTAMNIQGIFNTWAATNAPGSTLTLVNKDVEALRTEFLAAALAGSGGPDIMWTVADHAGPFTSAGIVQPVDSMVDLSLFVPSIANITKIAGKTYGIPLQAGNHLMLLYNKKFVKTPPATFADLVTLSQQLIKDNAGVAKFTPLAYEDDQSFWVFPVAHGFGSTEFAADGKTPALNDDGWVKTYQLFHDLKWTDKVVPLSCDYNCMDGGFSTGTAAMILNGDWQLGGDKGYVKVLGDNLGIAPWPSVGTDPTKNIPSPFIAGKFLMFPTSLKGDKLTVATAFAKFLTTDQATVLGYTVPNGRLPALLSALKDDKVVKDPVLAQTSAVLLTGVAQPVQPEMRCDFDAVTTSIRQISASATYDAATAAADAQKAATDCVAKLQ